MEVSKWKINYYKYKIDWNSLWELLNPNKFPNFRRVFVCERGKTWIKKHPISIEALKQDVLDENQNPLTAVHIQGLQMIDSPSNYIRELVFDMDANNKNDGVGLFENQEIRLCCRDKNDLCSVCWIFISYAIKFLRIILKSMFNIDTQSIEAYFSGRRGIHVFVWDVQTFTYSASVRKGIIEALKPDNFFNEHLNSYHHQLLAPIVDECVNGIIKGYATLQFTSFINEYNLLKQKHGALKTGLHFLHPIFDKAVTLNMTHNIRMPWSIHPATNAINYKIVDEDIPPNRNSAFNTSIDIATKTSEYGNKRQKSI